MEDSSSKRPLAPALILSLLTLISLILRVWKLWDHGLCQWDEGVYALSARWVATLGEGGTLGSPSHGPPLYTLILAFLFRLFGDSDFTILISSAVAGALITPVLFLLGKRWLGNKEGMVAAAIWALLPIGVLFSRRGLNDIWFTLLFLLGLLILSTHSFRGWRDLWIFIPAALAMLTKYHGAGVLIVAGMVLLSSPLLRSRDNIGAVIPSGKTLVWGLIFLAFTLAPWILFLIAKWDLLRLIENYGAYGGSSTPIMDRLWILDWGTGWLFIAAALVGGVISLKKREAGDLWLLCSVLFFVGVVVGYRPYPRLFLPLAALGCLLAAHGIVWLSERFPFRVQKPVLVTLGLMLLVSLLPSTLAVGLKTCDTYRRAGEFMNQMSIKSPVYVCAQQPMVYYLQQKSISVLDPGYESLNRTEGSLILITDHWVERYPGTRDFLESQPSQILFEEPLDLPEDVLMNSRNLETVLRMRGFKGEKGPNLTVRLIQKAEGP
ncbi:MAG: glycosyltransferase family 39 protein [Candidatus Omnitrophica bacterium]|nr:glycosyltransferase family 39 protein [Candidatus Omnitrophota bacterium]